jgi:hypothetical protein
MQCFVLVNGLGIGDNLILSRCESPSKQQENKSVIFGRDHIKHVSEV